MLSLLFYLHKQAIQFFLQKSFKIKMFVRDWKDHLHPSWLHIPSQANISPWPRIFNKIGKTAFSSRSFLTIGKHGYVPGVLVNIHRFVPAVFCSFCQSELRKLQLLICPVFNGNANCILKLTVWKRWSNNQYKFGCKIAKSYLCQPHLPTWQVYQKLIFFLHVAIKIQSKFINSFLVSGLTCLG